MINSACSDEHEALLQFLYLAPVGLIQTAADGAIALLNPVSAQLLMPLAKHGELANLFDALEDVAPGLRQQCTAYPQAHGVIVDALRLDLHGGAMHTRPQVLSLCAVKLDDLRFMFVVSDITAQVRRERELTRTDALLNAILSGISDYALVSLDSIGRIMDWNEGIGRVTGHAPAAVVGQPYTMFWDHDAVAPRGTPVSALDRLRDADDNGWHIEEGPLRRADGATLWCSALVSPLPDCDPRPAPVPPEHGAAYCLVLRDISDKREAGEQLRLATYADHLTGIANRRAFFEAAEAELRRSARAPRPTSLVLFDADHFKLVNDRQGHAAGDAVLRHLASLLRAGFRQADVVARIGGEEFAVLLPSTTPEEAWLLADRVRKLIAAQPAEFDGARIACTVSAGVAYDDATAADVETLLRRADLALYAAKALGRNRVDCWTPQLTDTTKDGAHAA